jgi:hypothetical protein
MLTPGELADLESTLLPALERHHLRLLAHGLRTLQAIAGQRSGPMPDRQAIDRWAAKQPVVAADPGFAAAFVNQLISASRQLTEIAAAAGRGHDPLALDLENLVVWARRQAETRIRDTDAPPSAGPGLRS